VRRIAGVTGLSRSFGEAKRIERRHVLRGLEKLSQRPQNEVAITEKLLQARYKQLLEGGSLLATNLDHQKLGRASNDGRKSYLYETPENS
jgi:hypothetical protein